MTLNLLEKGANGSNWGREGNSALQHSWRRQILCTREIWEQREDSLTWNLQYSEQKNKTFTPVSLQKKCRKTICLAPQLLSGLCRTQFSTLNRRLRPESASVFEAGISKLHPQIVDMLHPVCTSRSYIMCTASNCSSQVQCRKAGSLFFKMLAPVTVKSPRNVPSKRTEEISDPADLLSLV